MTSAVEPGRPLLSVVVPFKDAAAYLREAVDSILHQTWLDLEVVLVDDAGQDGSQGIAQNLETAHPGRVRVVKHDGRVNRGIGPSRALGITEARGSLVAFLDADDVWEPTHLADHVRLLQDNPVADMVCGRVWEWRTWANAADQDTLSQLAFAPGSVVPGARLLAAILRNGYYATTPCALTARRQVLLGCVPHLQAFPGMYEDQVMNSWLQLHGTAVMSGGTAAWYRQHKASFSAREVALSGQPIGPWVTFLEWLIEQLELTGSEDPEVRALATRALRDAKEHDRVSAARALRAAQPSAVVRLERFVRWIHSVLTRVTGDQHRSRVERLLSRRGADLRGDVLVLGGALPALAVPPGVRPRVSMHPRSKVRSGPHHPLSSLHTAAHDCIVVLPGEAKSCSVDLEVRHLFRALRPAGVLLLLSDEHEGALTGAVREVFGRDAVIIDHENNPGPARRPSFLVRSVVPIR